MPKVLSRNLTLNYDQQGSGEPLILIPYLAADHACYAFQVAEYSKHFTCISVDMRGIGESDKPGGVYTTEMFADDVAALMHAIGVPAAHIYGLSLGAGTGMWLAAKYPQRVKSLSLHSAWTRTDAYIRTVVQGWQVLAKAMNSMPDTVIQGIFPWCFTPDLYAQRPDYIQALCDFVRSRPKQPVASFLQQTEAVMRHDAEAQLSAIRAPTQISFGRHDLVTSTRFAEPLKNGIRNCELHIFEDCSHAPLYENVAAFNETTLAFLRKHALKRQHAGSGCQPGMPTRVLSTHVLRDSLPPQFSDCHRCHLRLDWRHGTDNPSPLRLLHRRRFLRHRVERYRYHALSITGANRGGG